MTKEIRGKSDWSTIDSLRYNYSYRIMVDLKDSICDVPFSLTLLLIIVTIYRELSDHLPLKSLNLDHMYSYKSLFLQRTL